jgi:predicted transcriptional regulator
MNGTEESKVRIAIIKKMYESSFTIYEIARVMRLATPTVKRYIH